jgi:Holliday junction resolvase RusA-like endonuclease
MQTITFTVLGQAQTAGSKQSFVPLNKTTKEPYRRPNGGIVVSTVDDNPKSKGWKKVVAKAAKEVFRGPLLEGPLIATFRFYRLRPKNHFAKFGLSKAGAQSLAPDTRPDVLKLARAAEDALIDVIYADDSQIVEEHLFKHWGEPARLEVEIKQMVESEVLLFETRVDDRPPWEKTA